MRKTHFHLFFALILITCATAGNVSAQGAPASDSEPQYANYKSTMVMDVEDVGDKLISLARAMPADKFTWRPSGNGFPSVSELFLLAAAQYYHRPHVWGGLMAKGYEYDGNAATANRSLPPLEKSTTNKDQVINELVDSTAYFYGIMQTLSEADMQKPIKISGRTTTPNANLFLMAGDMHEYLARAVDYARINGVTLPWMDQRQQEQQQRGVRTPPTE